MSKRQWLVLLMVFLTYLLLGASIFYHIESRLEIDKVAQARNERIEINALLHEHYTTKDSLEQNDILERLTRYCGKSVYNYTEGETDPLKWDFYNSFYFAYTVVSTIGYGNLAPTNMLSRVLMIFYGVVGIPMNGILLAQLGEFFGLVFVRAHKKYKSYKKHNSQIEYSKKLTPLETRKAGLAAQIFMYLTPGFVMFIFFPAFLFSHYEGWSYDEAVYYAFVTLTTIGFGDYVAGQDNTKGSGVLFILYKSFLIAWISFGLGYIVMIMTFIATGMRSKKIIRLEHKLAMNLKHTQSKIWNEFNKEVGYLRRVFNELQLSKVKPIYVDEYDYEAPAPKYQRSNSFPDLRDLEYGGMAVPAPPPHPRRRANSEVVPMENPVARVVSETDLQRIDKNATFATHAMVQPAELLARLVNILGYIPPQPDDANDGEADQQSPEVDSPRSGVQGFSDKDILSSEGGWKLGGDDGGTTLRKPRERAASEVRLDPKYEPGLAQRNVEWTWSGPAASRKIQEIIKARSCASNGTSNNGTAAALGGKENKSMFANLTLPISVPKTLLPRWIKQLSNKKESAGTRARNSISVDRLNERDGEAYLARPTGGSSNVNFGRSAGFPGDYEPGDSSFRPYFTHTGAGNLASSLEGSNLLEETSLADFLRALTALHTRVAGGVGEEYVKKPQRKMGTACLTPPKLPSLLALFSPPHGSTLGQQSNQSTVHSAAYNAAGRRLSLRNADNSSTTLMASSNRRNSLAQQPAVKPRRRFSLRPVPTPLGNSPQNGSPHLSGIHAKEIQGSTTTPPLPLAYNNSEGFVVDCPKESLVQMEGAPGVSTPITSSLGIRRFSLRPTVPNDASQTVAAQAPAAITKGLPRWRAGMLQRQINQINLRKRVRAFSLSDVNTEGCRGTGEKMSPPGLSPLVDGVRILGGAKDQNSRSSQKTVTIVSPRLEELVAPRTNDSHQASIVKTLESDFPKSRVVPAENQAPRTAVSTVREISGINKPFAFVEKTANSPNEKPFVYEPRGESSSREKDNSDSRRLYGRSGVAKNIESAPRILQGDSIDRKTSDRYSDDASRTESTRSSDALCHPTKKQSVSSCSTDTTDTKSISRKVSPVFVGAWTESRRNESRKISNASQQSCADSSAASSSRKSSTNKNPNDKPRVSIDSYKPLTDIKIEKPSQDPFERYRATMRVSMADGESLTEVKVDPKDSEAQRTISDLSNDLRESDT